VVPRLRILLPQPGTVVQAPFPVQYEVSGFPVGPGRGGLRLTLGDGGAFALSIPVSASTGVVYLNDNRLSGRRTLVFTLLTADQQALGNPEATVSVANVTIEGGK
jgi:hypothetical protein